MNIISQIIARQGDPFIDEPRLPFQMAERVTEYKEDPLVLSCVVKRLLELGQGYRDMNDTTTVAEITDQDRALAKNIKEYYTKKFFWRALSNNRPLSDYRRRLINLLENSIRSCRDQDCGIYYKLPYFYEEDLVYDEFKKTFDTTKLSDLGNSRQLLFLKQLTFLRTSFSGQRKNKIVRYWFNDDNNWLYGLSLTKDNPLLEIFDNYLKEHRTVIFDTRLVEDRIDDLHYYKMYNYKFVKEENA